MDYSNIVNESIDHNDGLENAAGFEENGLLILVSDIATEAVPDPAGTTPESLVEIAGNHILKAGKSPIPCYMMTEKSDFESPLAGEMFSMTNQPALTVFVPQNTAKNVGQYSRIRNARLIALAKPIGEDYYVQVGTLKLSAKIKSGSVKQGKGPNAEKGITFVVEAYSRQPYYFYKGAIPAPAPVVI